jgi:hypothetical protein
VELRISHLEEHAKAVVLHSNPTLSTDHMASLKALKVSQVLKRIQQRETMHYLFRKLGHLLRPSQAKGLSKIDIPDDSITASALGDPSSPKSWNSPWKTLTNPQDIAQVVKQMSIKNYSQAYNTPFGSNNLADMVGRSGDTPLVDNLISGSLPPTLPSMFPETRNILDTLAKPYPSASGTDIITPDEFISTYKVTKEATSSSPLGCHVGHYKATVSDPSLAQLHATMMSIPFQVGIIPDLWKQIMDIMLEKP